MKKKIFKVLLLRIRHVYEFWTCQHVNVILFTGFSDVKACSLYDEITIKFVRPVLSSFALTVQMRDTLAM